MKTYSMDLRERVVAARDAGGADLGIQRAVDDGLIDGPRMRIAITVLSQTSGHGDGWLPSGFSASFQVAHPGRPAGIVVRAAAARTPLPAGLPRHHDDVGANDAPRRDQVHAGP